MSPTTTNHPDGGVFQYEKLATPTSIRLLKILSSPEASVSPPIPDGFRGSDFQWIRCSCHTFDLEDENRPSYHGLSYTWGYPFPTLRHNSGEIDREAEYGEGYRFPILMNDKMMFVGKNLYEALCQLRLSTEEVDMNCSEDDLVLPGDDVERRIAPYHKTPLIRAAEKGYYDYVLELLQRGADVDAQDKGGQTALHYAAENGHLDIIRILVMAGADHMIKNNAGLTPLGVALMVFQRKGYDRTDVSHYLEDPWATEQQDDCQANSLQSTEYVWIDAICINQSNVPEKNVQVALMNRIYQEAAGTIVWLGSSDERTHLAKQATALICREASDWWLSMALNLEDGWETRYNQPHVHAKFEALNALLMRPWFHRVWIVQEVARARKVHVLCGEYRFSWHVITDYVMYNCSPTAIALIRETRVFAVVPSINSLNDDIVTDQMIMIRLVLNENSWERSCVQLRGREMGRDTLEGLPKGKDLTLTSLLFLTRKFKASEPRDRVFALLGLCDGDPGVAVNYDQPIVELFTSVAFPFIAGSDLHITIPRLLGLSVVEGTRIWRDSKAFPLPSWVPDFNMPSPTVVLLSDDYAAGMAIPSELRLGSGKHTLHLRGLRHSVVDLIENRESDIEEQLWERYKAMGISANAPDGVQYPVPQFCPRTFFKMAMSLSPRYPGGGTRMEALWRTVTNNFHGRQYDGVTNASEVAKQSFKDYVIFLLEARAKKDEPLRRVVLELQSTDPSNSLPSAEELSQHPADKKYEPIADTLPWDTIWLQYKFNVPFILLSWSSQYTSNHDRALSFHEAMFKYYCWKRLFRTTNGFLGMGSRKVRLGDEIWLIGGAATPFLLRPIGGPDGVGVRKFELLGEVYVHGIMYGEAAKSMDDVEEIELV
ncbi:hypothetical protein BKA64DRAFT_680061 [Cadophora sp. MPI-SDFR-AT-0126]|nr:hypothetical protein BKA64DRAFT_680061 [Leotiomycetes sp. MPI-SDFR-AT-0126]